MHVIVHTDNTSAFRGLQNHKIKGQGFYPLRHILLIASQFDIVVQPRWIAGKTNTIADALSRSNWKTLANLCPLWQYPYKATQFPMDFPNLLLRALAGQSSSGTASTLGREPHIHQQSLPMNYT
jgi:hypothetical protein